jgi:hypothetical protein
MALLGFLNELSMPGEDVAREVAITQLRRFAQSVQAIRRRRHDFALQTHEHIRGWRIGRDCTFDQFLGSPDTKDDARLLLGALNKAPLRRDLPAAQCDDHALEYRVDGRVAEALGLADLYDGLSISFDQPPWQAAHIRVERTGIVETDADEVELTTDVIEVRNACTPEHVGQHQLWLDQAGKPKFVDFADFEANRADRFTNLAFLDRALDQLRATDQTHPWWHAACNRLDELQEAMVAWNPAATPEPQWKSHVTGEHQQRRQLCNFVDLDGATRCFDQHARFTPGAGRLHFRLDAVDRKVIVAHIGQKL